MRHPDSKLDGRYSQTWDFLATLPIDQPIQIRQGQHGFKLEMVAGTYRSRLCEAATRQGVSLRTSCPEGQRGRVVTVTRSAMSTREIAILTMTQLSVGSVDLTGSSPMSRTSSDADGDGSGS